MMKKVANKTARGAMIGALAVAAFMIALPGVASAGHGARNIADRLERIAVRVERIDDIRGLYRKDQEIDRLQSRLIRLERISQRQDGRRAKRNRKTIDRLQRRLRKIERRVEAKIERQDRRRGHRARSGWGRGYDRGTGYRGRDFTHSEGR